MQSGCTSEHLTSIETSKSMQLSEAQRMLVDSPGILLYWYNGQKIDHSYYYIRLQYKSIVRCVHLVSCQMYCTIYCVKTHWVCYFIYFCFARKCVFIECWVSLPFVFIIRLSISGRVWYTVL